MTNASSPRALATNRISMVCFNLKQTGAALPWWDFLRPWQQKVWHRRPSAAVRSSEQQSKPTASASPGLFEKCSELRTFCSPSLPAIAMTSSQHGAVSFHGLAQLSRSF